jgi:hypothetical protein
MVFIGPLCPVWIQTQTPWRLKSPLLTLSRRGLCLTGARDRMKMTSGAAAPARTAVDGLKRISGLATRLLAICCILATRPCPHHGPTVARPISVITSRTTPGVASPKPLAFIAASGQAIWAMTLRSVCLRPSCFNVDPHRVGSVDAITPAAASASPAAGSTAYRDRG